MKLQQLGSVFPLVKAAGTVGAKAVLGKGLIKLQQIGQRNIVAAAVKARGYISYSYSKNYNSS